MKKSKTVNLILKIKLGRIPSFKEKRKLVESIAYILDLHKENSGIYDIDFKDEISKESLIVDHHYVSLAKNGKI